MNDNNRLLVVMVLMFVLGGLCFNIFGSFSRPNLSNNVVYELGDVYYDRVSTVSCESDSMGLMFRCDDIVYSQEIDKDHVFVDGDVYIYKDPSDNVSVIHRLSLCFDENCSYMAFRGDNNAVGELVPKEWVKYKVVAQEFK